MSTRARRATGLIKLVHDKSKPLSHQLADTIRRLIVEGIWIKDDKLPGSRSIATDANVSRNTVNAALEILLSEGMLQSRGRAGLFVTWKHQPRAQASERVVASDFVRHRPLSLEAVPVELFPLDIWRKLQTRYWSKASSRSLDLNCPTGVRPLCEAIAVLANVTAGISCNADQVVIVAGFLDALTVTKHALMQGNGRVLIEDPAHVQTRLSVRAAGLEAVPVPVDSQGINIEAALHGEDGATLAIVRPAFQFPTGAMLSPARARELAEWSKQKSAVIFEDARESEFSFSKREFRSLATFEPGAVVHFNSFSRTLFPTLGIGYLIVPDHLIDCYRRSRAEVEVHIPAATQMVLADFINAGYFTKQLHKSRGVLAERQAALLERLEQLRPTLNLDRQFGGLHVCARLAHDDRDTEIVARATSVDVEIAPLSTTFAKQPAAQGLLFGFAAFEPSEINQAMDALTRALS